jgi:hypothetical protein
MTSEETEISFRAITFVREHFELLNAGRLDDAREQLFSPAGTSDRPLTVYLERMGRFAPFEVRTLRVKRYKDVRPLRPIGHGSAATICLDLVVAFALWERTVEMAVWWFPAGDKFLISSRPWITEAPPSHQAN